MKIIKINTRLSIEERETVLSYDNVDKKWVMDTTVPKHANKAKKQGWTQVVEYQYQDGTVVGGQFEAPARAITIRSAEKKVKFENQPGDLIDEDEEDCE